MRTLPRTRSTWVLSCRCPGVRTAASGRPVPSLTKWIFVPNPPRERPRAWSAGSPAGRFFFRRPGRRAGGPDGGAVDAEQVRVDQPGLAQPELEAPDDAVEQAGLAEGVEPVVDGLPGAEPIRQVPPRGAGVQPPEDAVEHGAVVPPLPARPDRPGREERPQEVPLGVGQFVSPHARLDPRPRPPDSSDRP